MRLESSYLYRVRNCFVSFYCRVIRQQIYLNSLVHSLLFQEFSGNFDGSKVVKHLLLPQFTANFVRFTPKECKAADLCCMRVEIYVSGEDNEKKNWKKITFVHPYARFYNEVLLRRLCGMPLTTFFLALLALGPLHFSVTASERQRQRRNSQHARDLCTRSL